MKMTKQQRMGTALQREAVPKKILISEKSVSMQIRVIWSLPYTMIFKNFWQVPSPKDPEQVRLSWDKSEGPLVSKWMKAWNSGLTLEGDYPNSIPQDLCLGLCYSSCWQTICKELNSKVIPFFDDMGLFMTGKDRISVRTCRIFLWYQGAE